MAQERCSPPFLSSPFFFGPIPKWAGRIPPALGAVANAKHGLHPLSRVPPAHHAGTRADYVLVCSKSLQRGGCILLRRSQETLGFRSKGQKILGGKMERTKLLNVRKRPRSSPCRPHPFLSGAETHITCCLFRSVSIRLAHYTPHLPS